MAFLLTYLRANLTCMGELNHDVSCHERKECNVGTWIWDLTYGINHKKLITNWPKRKQPRISSSSIWVRPSVLKTDLNRSNRKPEVRTVRFGPVLWRFPDRIEPAGFGKKPVQPVELNRNGPDWTGQCWIFVFVLGFFVWCWLI